ncbi:hypothetical protein SAMN04488503_2208 [Humidesulfovibrio mexicanus]|uniref:Uncharacterized protein n=1 Tax=Humidesulfovibrio mexicanus TaxID=147047 RepID=A0A239AU61_9BACT|nr:zinc finger-like domain-containing protein [Humidesulfovibrio mexicanus]SNR98862.1 hypothetical protein SAMN04488503_2208 [Humidesulfovibrio mexicanus]
METEKLALAFGLTRDSWLTMPRSLMGAMPPEWQDRLAPLIDEFRAAWPGLDEVRTRVEVVHEAECPTCKGFGAQGGEQEPCDECGGTGKVDITARWFYWLNDYRRPNFKRIAQLMFPPKTMPQHQDYQAALARVRHNPALDERA